MAYNNRQKIKWYQYVISVYELYKKPDIPDTRIVKNYFPLHNIFINYRHWHNIKGMVLPRDGRIKVEPLIVPRVFNKKQRKNTK